MTQNNYKHCTGCCDATLPATTEYFGRDKRGKYGLKSRCKNCIRQYYADNREAIAEQHRQYYADNREAIAEKARQYRADNPEKEAERHRQYRADNPEKEAEQHRQYYADNREAIAERGRQYRADNPEKEAERGRQYYADNREARAERGRQYRADNPEAIAEYQRQYYADNREAIAEYHRQYRADNQEAIAEYHRQYHADNQEARAERQRQWRADNPEYYRQHRADNPELARIKNARRRARKLSLPDTFTLEQWFECLDYFHYCCAACGVQLRDLFGKVEPHADHWIPLSSDDCPGTVAQNMICLCNNCNLSKSATLPDVWLKQKFGATKAKQITMQINAYFTSLSTIAPLENTP